MTKEEMQKKIDALELENKALRRIIADCDDENNEEHIDDEALINQIIVERLAAEDRANDERAAEDELYAYELSQIRYLESRYDYEYGW